MNELKVIKEQEVLGRDFRIYGDIENPLFLAKDVATWIEHTNPTEMLRGIDEDEKLNSTILSAGQKREVTFITEYGLYEILMQSRKPIAKEFKKKVKEILKTIRQNGMYATDQLLDNPDLLIQVATRLKEEKELRLLAEQKNLQLESIIEANKEKVDIFEQMMNGKNYMDMGQVAKTLNIKNMGRNKLYEFLRSEKILMSNNEPYQNYVNCDWFKVIVKPITKGYKVENVNVTLVSVKGLKGIYNKLKTKGYAA